MKASRLVLVTLALSLLFTELQAETRIVIDGHASTAVRHAAGELKADLEKAFPDEAVHVQAHKTGNTSPTGQTEIFLGQQDAIGRFSESTSQDRFPLLKAELEPETFIMQSSGQALLIAGADDRGVLYGVYEFSRQVLGIDPMAYWTGKTPVPGGEFRVPEIAHREPPPVFKLRGYFDNDNDHLANWRGRKLIIEFETWKQMIDSLARLRYNYVDIHDLLGRPEYYLRDYYTQMTEFHTDLELVERVIDYIHSKGMLVQIPMMLAWEFRHITLEQVCLSEYHDLWVDTWEYYLSETPLGKADLFLVRPRHPIYDWAYKCPKEEEQGIEPGPLIDAAFAELVRLINEYRPGATLVTDLWQEGRGLWLKGEFTPDRNMQILWADNGYADFGGWPEDQKGYPFGVYLHAGVWHNQVVQDPYPDLIQQALGEAAERGMTHNALVNGQSFKPFILNLEASARALWNPLEFDPERFYHEWTSRYFGTAASKDVVKVLKLLHEANGPVAGYRDVTKASQKIMKNLVQGIQQSYPAAAMKQSLKLAWKAEELARVSESQVPAGSIDVYDDQILFPVTLFRQNLELLESLILLNDAVTAEQDTAAAAGMARKRLATLHESLNAGSRWSKWEGWYLPENFRIHTPPPSIEELEKLIDSL